MKSAFLIPPRSAAFSALVCALFLAAVSDVRPAAAQCGPDEPPVQRYTGGISSVCPCFVPGEEAGTTFLVPAAHFPIEVLRVGIGWASQFGGGGQQLEQAIHIYGAGLPNPGPRLHTLGGPVLTDGAINVFDLQAQLGSVLVNNGPVTVTLEFLNSSSPPFGPGLGFDSGCTPGANVVKANPGGWSDACNLGVTGDWVFFMVYRKACQSGSGEITVSNAPAILANPRPNPFIDRTEIEFVLAAGGQAEVAVFDIQGRRVAALAAGEFQAGRHSLSWNGRGDGGSWLNPGLYFVRLVTNGRESVRKIVLSE